MNYYRIFLTILASFCAFFAYICRLNLSMTINKMVSKCPSSLPTNHAEELIENKSFSYKSMTPFIFTEEHAYTFMSKPIEKCSIKNIHNKNSSRLKRSNLSNSIVPLTIEFDNQQGKPNMLDKNEPELNANLLDWDEGQRNDLLGAFFWGYAVAQIPAARVAEIFGAKPLFLFVGFGASFCSLIFPLASKAPNGYYYAFATRVLLGSTQGALFPAVYVFFCEWLPKTERPKWLPFPSAFSRVGTIVMNLIVPLILDYFNWEAVFYFSGGASLVWCIIFIIFASSRPQDNFWISKGELIYIESHMEPRIGSLAQQSSIMTASGFTINESALEAPKKPPINWIKMCSNKAVLIMTIVMFTAEWSNCILLIKLPNYLESVFNMDTKEVGLWSSIMIGIFCFSYPAAGWLATKLDNSSIEWFTPLKVRKLFELVANLIQAIGCILIAFNHNKIIVIGSLFLMMIGRSIVGGGQCLMPPELSKDYPGTVFAYSNTIANFAGILGPKSITWIVNEPKEHGSWFYFYIMSACIFVTGGIIFSIFADNRPHNYSRKPTLQTGKSVAMSQAQLHKIDLEPEEFFKMETFGRVAATPNTRNIPNYRPS